MVEVDLVHCNLANNQYQHESETYFYTQQILCLSAKAEPTNLVFLKNCNTEFNDILMFLTFTEQSGRPLDRKGKFNLTLLINKKG